MRLLARVVAPAVLGLLISAGANPALAQATVERNVVYGMYSGLALLMDVHRPAEPNGYGIVFIAGSGWTRPLDADAAELKEGFREAHLGAGRLVEAGYTVFAINHRATPRFAYPAPVEDAQRAVRYVRHHAARLGIAPERIGAYGESSGGHLASMLGVMDGNEYRRSTSPVDRENAKVQTVVALYPPTDFLSLVPFGSQNATMARLLAFLFRGAVRAAQLEDDVESSEEAMYREASPTTYVSPDDPPLLLVHGDADALVPYEQSEIFLAELEASGVDVRLITMPGGGHARDVAAGPNPPDYIGAMVDWFDTHLKE